MPSSAPASGGSNAATDFLFKLLLGGAAIAVPFSHLAWLGGNLATRLTTAAPWAPYQPAGALLHPEQLWPHTGSTALFVGRIIAPSMLMLLAAAFGARWWIRHKSQGGKKAVVGMAKPRDIAPLMAKATTAKAKSLRPSLAALEDRQIQAHQTGILLGNVVGTRSEARMGFEDVGVFIMAPRSGKTTSIAIPTVLNAPGPVLFTSNKAAHDAYTATLEARAKVGTTWTMDPQQIAHASRDMWWDILANARTLEGANRLAGHFVSATVDAAQQNDFWSKAAQNVLSQLMLAAANDGRPITDVMQWLAFPSDRTPLDLLRDHGYPAVAAQLSGTISGPPETRDGIFETARQYAACLLNSEIAAWVTPQKDLPEFRPADFVRGRDTLYLLSKDGGGGAGALIAACADSVMLAATAQAERTGGRLDPPLVAILDEAANVCKIQDLPDLYSHLGSRGVQVLTILQSYQQGKRVWGDTGMDSLWSAATIKLAGPGIDDMDFADRLSRMVGERDVETVSTSTSESGTSTSVSMRQERILPPEKIRAMPKGSGLLFATGLPGAMLAMRPWYAEPGADEISAASDRASKAITARAITKSAPTQDDYGQAA
ncbi:type IV secretory system conjugative DNA transfer family protein [Streptomyces nigrescens]